MQRELVQHEKTAWLNYKGYCLFVAAGNHGRPSQGVFLGDERSRELWRTWMDRRRHLLEMRRTR